MPSVSDFLVERLENAGVQHVFGVPGEYVCNFFKKVLASDGLTLIGTACEAGAANAADAYARIRGVGCVAVTYNVGAFKVLNSVAAAYAERSPVVVICGSPGKNVPAHAVKTQKEMFDHITCASTVLSNPSEAGYEIDRVMEALQHHKQPVYIELPADVADKPLTYDVYKQGTPQSPKTFDENLEEAVAEVGQSLTDAKQPVIVAGVEVARFDLGGKLQKFAERHNIPIATTLLSKSVIPENHPLYLGVYSGDYSQRGVQDAVEGADFMLKLGVMKGDVVASGLSQDSSKKNVVACNVGELRVGHHVYKHVQFADFAAAILRLDLPAKPTAVSSNLNRDRRTFTAQKARITTARLFEKIDSVLNEQITVVADVGNALFGAAELTVHHKNGFIGGALYGCMGTAIGAALGVGLAKPSIRPLVVVGDGAFQMSVAELGTLYARRIPAIIVVLNNGGYATENLTCPAPFNSIPPWNYHKAAEMVGGAGVLVEDEEALEEAFGAALRADQLFVINVAVEPGDNSPTLARMKGKKP